MREIIAAAVVTASSGVMIGLGVFPDIGSRRFTWALWVMLGRARPAKAMDAKESGLP
jgi:hypothetical protein